MELTQTMYTGRQSFLALVSDELLSQNELGIESNQCQKYSIREQINLAQNVHALF